MTRISLRYERTEFQARVDAFLDSQAIAPQKRDYYYMAFVHRSVLNEASTSFYAESNERLEFLGDAILELVTTEQLFYDFPKKPEGDLTDIRSALVRGRNLARVASSLGFSEAIQLSRGEFRVSGHENPYILANTVEAFIGAMYLDLGMDVAREWILKHIYVMLPEILDHGLYVDPKSYLQELTQEIWGILPTYEVIAAEGQDHNKTYKIQVLLGDCVLGEGKGTSKKKGEQDAAENAISARAQWERRVCLPRKKSEK